MDNSNQQVLPEAPFITNNLQTPVVETTMSKITGFFSDYKNIAIIAVVLIVCLFVAYKMKYLDFLFNKKQKKDKEEEKENDNTNDDLNVLNLEKDYYIPDENNTPMKINLKEMITLHKHYLEQQLQQQQLQQQQLQQQQLHQQQLQQQQLHQQQLHQQHQEQLMKRQQEQLMMKQQEEKMMQQKKKIKHPKNKKIESSSEEYSSEQQLSTNDLEHLKNELAELEKENNNI